MTAAFDHALNAPGPHRTALIQAQQQWLREWALYCPVPVGASTAAQRQAGEDCLATQYQNRTDELAAEAQATKSDDQLCSSLARRLELAAKGGLPSGMREMPIRGLAAVGDGFVRIEDKSYPLSQDQVAETLQSRFQATQELLDGLQAMSGWSWWLTRLPGTSVHAVESSAGTMQCLHFLFFDAPSGLPANPIKGPSIVEDSDDTAFCWKTAAWLGSVIGKPAFLVESDDDLVSSISISPRLGGNWTEACSLTVSFAANFSVSGAYCGKTTDCAALTSLAKPIAMQFDKDSHNIPSARGLPDPPENAAKVARMTKLGNAAGWNIEIPTFGKQLDTSYTGFGPESILFPVNLHGESYLARLGHAWFGWRESPDYLLAIFQLEGEALEPIAGFHVSKIRGALNGAIVDP